MRAVYLDDDGAVRIYRPIGCTGVAARWCPIHGDCTDRGPDADGARLSDHCSEADCPLHGRNSQHGNGE